LERVREAVEAPDQIVRSRTDPAVVLFYRYYDRTPVTRKHLCVVAKTGAESPFVITVYYTDTVKQGEGLWSAK
jgi:hypothetical protein